MRFLICGSRKKIRGTYSIIKSFVTRLDKSEDIIMTGGATGTDAIALMIAKENNINTEVYPPDYKTYGDNAPIRRNINMVDKADFILAIWNCQSKGTDFVINYAKANKKNIKVIIDLLEFKNYVFKHGDYTCVKCGFRQANWKPTDSKHLNGNNHLTIDHIHQRYDGGDKYDLNNVQILCRECHNEKTIYFNNHRGRPEKKFISKMFLSKEESFKLNEAWLNGKSKRKRK